MTRTIVGVMGPGSGATADDERVASDLGRRIALEGWVLLTGGWRAGVMDAASRGARDAGGLVIGVLPTRDAEGASEAVDVAILTGMGEARNLVNVLSSRVLFFVGMSAGTASELALAIKAGRPAILVGQTDEVVQLFGGMAGDGAVTAVDGVERAIAVARDRVGPG